MRTGWLLKDIAPCGKKAPVFSYSSWILPIPSKWITRIASVCLDTFKQRPMDAADNNQSRPQSS